MLRVELVPEGSEPEKVARAVFVLHQLTERPLVALAASTVRPPGNAFTTSTLVMEDPELFVMVSVLGRPTTTRPWSQAASAETTWMVAVRELVRPGELMVPVNEYVPGLENV